MPVPHEKRLKFFVYVIESPSAPDLYHKRSEGEMIEKALSLHNIPCVTRLAISQEAFEAAIKIGLPEEMKNFPGNTPVLHISAHGEEYGLQLSNGEKVEWANLRDLLLPVNKALNGTLLLCMSSCKGFSACRMAMRVNGDEHPFFAVIGNSETPAWSDTAIAYSSFYHLIAKGEYIVHAVDAMKVAAGDKNFTVITAPEAQRAYIDVIQKTNTDEAQAELQQEADKKPPSSMAKQLENEK